MQNLGIGLRDIEVTIDQKKVEADELPPFLDSKFKNIILQGNVDSITAKVIYAPARVNYPEALGLRHLAFKVKSVDDTVKELNAKGIATEPVRLDDYTGKKMTFFHDPDNLPLEIHE